MGCYPTPCYSPDPFFQNLLANPLWFMVTAHPPPTHRQTGKPQLRMSRYSPPKLNASAVLATQEYEYIYSKIKTSFD